MKKSLFIVGFLVLQIHVVTLAQRPSVVKANDLITRIESSSDTIFLVNFWATWCVPCIEELPVFKSSLYKSEANVIKILLVSLDFKQNFKNLDGFINKHNIEEEVLWMNEKNPNSWINKVDKTWSGAIPATKIYHTGKELFYEGQMTQDQIQTMINKLKH